MQPPYRSICGRSLVLVMLSAVSAPAQQEHRWSGSGCTTSGCHSEIEPIRRPDSQMFRDILQLGGLAGDTDGCIVCHGGDPTSSATATAHRGAPETLTAMNGPDEFFADPSSPWVNERSCGLCHGELVRAQWNSLMMTEAGKIQGTTWSFGSLEGYEHRWSNYDGENPTNPDVRLGTDDYRQYMAEKTDAHPNIYVDKQEKLPEAPTTASLGDLSNDPAQAVFTYIRGECQRCHLGVKGRERRGDFRGMGCGACHMPYSNAGLYEGADPNIPGDEPGHALVHQMQGTRDAKVSAGDVHYSGVPVETCTTCHNRGKRIGVSYQGLMEAAWDSPYTEGGGGQLALYSKHYIALSKDVHYQKGMLCQDCHTSGDIHGDGFIAATNLASIEIECSDCHGTPESYPWELPLGFGDENNPGVQTGDARATAQELPNHLAHGAGHDKRDGWIRTARGNPMPEVVRDGDRVLVHTAGGKDLWLEPLKKKLGEGTLSVEAQVAMVQVDAHINRMECYACHSSWAPQCYGCHVKVDYSGGKESFDWVAAGNQHKDPQSRAVNGEASFGTTMPGEVTELRSYMRWEDPALGVNGEGRVSPIIPGCQVSVTVIGEDGNEVVRNHIFRTQPHSEGSGPEGQLGSDMSPVQPHTTGKPRTCESCHASDKALGYGISSIGVSPAWDEEKIVDLTTADGQVIPQNAPAQIEAIPGLERDWSAVVTPDGKQLQTVGHHFAGSGPLSAEQRIKMARQNVCIACHKELPQESLAVGLMHHVAEVTGVTPNTNDEHKSVVGLALISAAWLQVAAGICGLALVAWLLLGRRKSSVLRE